ncbi:MAG: PEP-CTERM sorting domain-containing protein [Planctomycetota bacterium]
MKSTTTHPLIRTLSLSIAIATGLIVLATGMNHSVVASMQTGQQGTDGAHGEAGDPGTDGTDGGQGGDVVRPIQEGIPNFQVFGGQGGRGGDGGQGIDGDDSGIDAMGGLGGQGGNGGDVFAETDTTFSFTSGFAVGGRGGDGGLGGLGSSSTFNGQGGNGGHGGNSRIIADGSERSKYFTSHGGYGGHGYGFGSVGGQGGRASFSANIAGERSSRLTIVTSGGAGGDGFDGADGGNGASSRFGFGHSSIGFSELTSNTATLDLTLWGGRGGHSTRGNGGRGATSRLHLDSLVDLYADVANNRFLSSTFRMRGGSGGKANAIGRQGGNGGHGATAFLHASDSALVTESYAPLSFFLEAGNGGSALGRRGSGNGGHGASAGIIGSQKFTLTDQVDRYININSRFYGGNGGHAQGDGIAGNGGSVSLINPFTIDSNAATSQTIAARGGHGGWGKNNGFGGDAAIEVIETVDGPNVSPTGNFTYNTFWLFANGGRAGQGLHPQRVAHGGDASIVAQETDLRGIQINGTAVGGQSNWGNSGDANVHLVANVLRDPENPQRQLQAIARGNAESQFVIGAQAAHGTNSTTYTEANSEYVDGLSSSTSIARGGWGFLSSGRADARTRAQSGGEQASTLAISHALGDRSRTTDNYSLSYSSAESRSNTFARNQATSVGQVSLTQGMSVARSTTATASGLSTTETTNWRTKTRINTRAVFVGDDPGTASTNSITRFLSGRENLLAGMDATNSVEINLMPDNSPAELFVTQNSDLGDVFVDDVDARILGYGSVHGGFVDPTDVGSLDTFASFDITLESRHFFDDNRLMFGLMNLESAGDGFSDLDISIMHNSLTLVDQTFTSSDDAVAYLDSRLLNLGQMPLDRELIEFQFNVNMTFDDAADQFGFGFVFGNANARPPVFSSFNAVPEPGSTLALGMLLLAVGFRRRRR